MGWFTNWITGGAEDDADEAIEDAMALEQESRAELNRLKDVYANMDIGNPFANMKNEFEGMENQFADMQNQFSGLENTMEDLTVNQQQAQFQAQQSQQNQANIMEGLRGAAGGSGIAALAQSLAKSGQLASQQASASIGQQESANQMAAAQRAGQLQDMEARGAAAVDLQRRQGAAAVDLQRRQGAMTVQQQQMAGEERAQGRELDRAATMYGIQAQTTGAYADQVSAAQQARQDVTTNAWDALMPF
tara:strand:- start:256 stop:996 length:741 start_codon:yes stop_codon:yes gene_type:complete